MAIEIDMKKLSKEYNVEIKLKNLHQWRFRVWVGMKLMEAAAWLMWVNVEFIEDENS